MPPYIGSLQWAANDEMREYRGTCLFEGMGAVSSVAMTVGTIVMAGGAGAIMGGSAAGAGAGGA